MGAQLGQLALWKGGKTSEKFGRHHIPQDGVAEELHTLVGCPDRFGKFVEKGRVGKRFNQKTGTVERQSQFLCRPLCFGQPSLCIYDAGVTPAGHGGCGRLISPMLTHWDIIFTRPSYISPASSLDG